MTQSNKPLNELYNEVNRLSSKSRASKNEFDFIVIGLGTMGSSACYTLAKEGFSVLGIEQYDISHSNGSHSGQSRLIRQAYYEHPDYVPLLKEAYQGWHALEKESNSSLFYPTGILYSGKHDEFLISGSKKSALEHNIPLDLISTEEQKTAYPQFNIPDHFTTILEPNAGFITPERAILTYVKQSIAHKACIHTNEVIEDWKSTTDSVSLRTNKGVYKAKKIIFTSGAWSAELLPFLRPSLRVTKQLIAWVNTNSPEMYSLSKMPCWGINQEETDGLFYGFPELEINEFGGPKGMKIGYHFPGEITAPDQLNAIPSSSDKQTLTDFMDSFMPGCFRSFSEFKGCLYTYSPDENFMIDNHPDHDNIVFATGFSGHGFKFAPVIGKALTDLATTGKSNLPIGFLGLNRLS